MLDETQVPPLGARLYRCFAYFTIQGNLLVAVTSWQLVRDPARDGRWWRPVRLAAIVGITVTGLVHFVLLRPLLHLEGASYLCDKLLHMVVPVLAVLAWLLVGPRPRAGCAVAGALAWPILWLVVILAQGAVSGWYPYPFLDVDAEGVGTVVATCVGITVLFVALSALAVWLDRRMRPGASLVSEQWNFDTSATADSRSRRSPTATGSPTARRSRTTSRTHACGPRSTPASRTFDTADVYANTAAESVLGEALKGERRESLEIFTKVYWPTGPEGQNDTGLSRKHIMESINGSLHRLQTDYVDLYQAHRFDTETPLEETMQAFADVVRQGKALYIGVSEWTADQIRAGARARRRSSASS